MGGTNYYCTLYLYRTIKKEEKQVSIKRKIYSWCRDGCNECTGWQSIATSKKCHAHSDMHSIPWPYYSHNHPCLSSSGTPVSTKFTATYVHVGWLLNNVAMVWSAYALCACMVLLVWQCVLCQPVHLFSHPYISYFYGDPITSYKLAYLLPQLNVSIVSYWSIIVFLFILFLYAVSYTEFESYSSSSTQSSTCDIPVLPNDRKCWARGREGEGGSKCAMISKMFIFIVILLSFGFPHFTESDAGM